MFDLILIGAHHIEMPRSESDEAAVRAQGDPMRECTRAIDDIVASRCAGHPGALHPDAAVGVSMQCIRKERRKESRPFRGFDGRRTTRDPALPARSRTSLDHSLQPL